jgi:cell division protein ZapA
MSGVTVEIMGQALNVASDSDEEWVRLIARQVDEKIREVQAKGRTVSSVSMAILAALNFADELERLRRDHQKVLGRVIR